MESEGGGVAAAITSRSITSQHSTLHQCFLSTSLIEPLNNTNITTSTYSSGPEPVSSLTLGAVLNGNKESPPSNKLVVRTLLEVIQNDDTLGGSSSPTCHFGGKKSWKSFKERLKLKRASLLHSSASNHNHNHNQTSNSRHSAPSTPIPQSDVLLSTRSLHSRTGTRTMNRRNSLRSNSLRRVDSVPANDHASREIDSDGSPRTGGSFMLSTALAAEREQTRRRLSRDLVEGNGNNNGEGDEGHDLGNGNEPVRMSLMDLLEETDRQAGISGLTYRLDDKDKDEEVEEESEEEEDSLEEDGDGDGKLEYCCCVCMVRHKGAAFIPCGHTFCRLCSRELWVQRGNCPVCNNFILEVLDIF